MKNLYNPTDKKIKVQISGVIYSVDPKSTIELPEEAAKYWVHNLHSFMVFVSPEPKKEEVVKAEVAEVAEVKEEKESIVKKAVKKLKK